MLRILARSPLIFHTPERLTDVTSWHGHIPFAFFAVQCFQPRVLVELGTHKGDSYCAFCQAVKALNMQTLCYAVDTWKGDSQSGYYGAEVLEELDAYHASRFGGFSTLLPVTFDQALEHFDDGTVDLLHLDGLHAYEAVRHDFEAWLPKLSDRAVVLMHDTHVEEEGFGVWRLWKELAAHYPSYAFYHSNGLGVLAVGKRPADGARALVHLPEDEADWVRRLFQRLGETIMALREAADLQSRLRGAEREIKAQKDYTGSLESRIEEIAENSTQRGLYIEVLEGRIEVLEGRIEELAEKYEERGRYIEVLEKRLSERFLDRLLRKTRSTLDGIKYRWSSTR
jgi:hypothetical protein